MSVRVVVADDHAVVREGLRALLGAVEGYTIVGTAATGREAVRAAVTLRPDVLVLDINMPDGSGIEAARKVTREAPGVAVLMLTMFDDDDSVFAAMRAGALGYVLKGADPEDIIRAISGVAAGNAVFGPGIAQRAIAYLSGPRPPDTPFESLTPREREVLDLIAAGLGNTAIAARLRVSPNTVANHISSVFAKLQVASRAEAIIKARDAGLGH
ncbi:response regulator [Phytohabitans sp. LJ34]|uniref:response regulator n=1 Tax=Phytohabitans sp. LJ34 TaxID=3452217 RepID=UPI003F8B1B5C